jgi:hypothetical protein
MPRRQRRANMRPIGFGIFIKHDIVAAYHSGCWPVPPPRR